WPSAPANFLKHADRDADALLAAANIDHEMFLMSACGAYVHLMKIPSPEMMALVALWSAKNEAVPVVHDPARELVNQLVSMNEQDRCRACAEWVRKFKSEGAAASTGL